MAALDDAKASPRAEPVTRIMTTHGYVVVTSGAFDRRRYIR